MKTVPAEIEPTANPSFLTREFPNRSPPKQKPQLVSVGVQYSESLGAKLQKCLRSGSCVTPNPSPHSRAINRATLPASSSLLSVFIFSILLILHFSPSGSCDSVTGPSARFCACFASIERAARCKILERPLF
jgi:hypothetical protein